MLKQSNVLVNGLDGHVTFTTEILNGFNSDEKSDRLLQAGRHAKEIGVWLYLLNRWNGAEELELLRDPFDMMEEVDVAVHQIVSKPGDTVNKIIGMVPEDARRWRGGWTGDYRCDTKPIQELDAILINHQNVYPGLDTNTADAIKVARALYAVSRWDGQGPIQISKKPDYFFDGEIGIFECDQGYFEVPKFIAYDANLGDDFWTKGHGYRHQGEINDLMRQWEADPQWDIETTVGFERYYDDLLEYRQRKEAEWREARQAKQQRLQHQAGQKGVPVELQELYVEHGYSGKSDAASAVDQFCRTLNIDLYGEQKREVEQFIKYLIKTSVSAAVQEILEQLGSRDYLTR